MGLPGFLLPNQMDVVWHSAKAPDIHHNKMRLAGCVTCPWFITHWPALSSFQEMLRYPDQTIFPTILVQHLQKGNYILNAKGLWMANIMSTTPGYLIVPHLAILQCHTWLSQSTTPGYLNLLVLPHLDHNWNPLRWHENQTLSLGIANLKACLLQNWNHNIMDIVHRCYPLHSIRHHRMKKLTPPLISILVINTCPLSKS